MNATRIAVGPDGGPWILSRTGAIQRHTGGEWHHIDGHATDIAIGPNGTVWVVGGPEERSEQGFPLLRQIEHGWETIGKSALAVAVDPDSRPWIADANHAIHRFAAQNRWETLPGRATDIAIGPDGTAWILGAPPDQVDDGYPIYRWSGADWDRIVGAAVRITVDPDGLPWVVNAQGVCYRLNRKGDWEDVPRRASDLAVGARGSIWAIGETGGPENEGLVQNWGHNSFCILPFKELTVFPDGRVVPCCQFEGSLTTDDGGKASIYSSSMHDIWNSSDMRSIRRDMLDGKRISACSACYYVEDVGNLSLRDSSNQNWKNGWLNTEKLTPSELETQAAAQDYRLPAPEYIELGLGNLCNLKCRMCNGSASSRINRDPIHGRWNGSELDVIPPHGHWWELEKIRQDILRHPERIDTIYLIGGETGIIKEVGSIMRLLVDAGVAHKVTIWLSTNATTTNQPWCDLAKHFRQIVLHVSLDGVGKTFEYIRYPAQWDRVTENVEFFRKLPQTTLKGALTLQAYNALDIVEVCRYLDGMDIPYSFNVFHSPVYLTTQVLPPAIRRIAAARIFNYVEKDCKPAQQAHMSAMAAGLEHSGDQWDPELFRQFMLFTNDLDSQRQQSIRDSLPELWAGLERAGAEWSCETRYAPASEIALGCAGG
jgi:MoaA/NifB/PqqE/SkfB family radical SAM enzyme